MTCPKCHGFMAQEYDQISDDIETRCLNCGYREHPPIEPAMQNRDRCTNCHNPPVPGYALCARCRDWQREYRKSGRKARRVAA